MIQNPQNYIEQFVKAGADILTFHYEAVKQPRDVIDLIKSYNIKAGISIKPDTLPEKILEFLPDLDLVLIMTVEPGFGGQSFINYCADKIKVIKKHAHEGLFIQVDGGINDVTAKICTDLGANSLVAGNYIFKSNDFRSAIKLLRQGS